MTCCALLELRQYTCRPGQRDTLIALFERELIEPQEACGNRLIGQFRDLDDADRFVWLRGFGDLAARLEALGAFYGGDVWKRHRDAANATMIDSDNVLLLEPAAPNSDFVDLPPRAAPRASEPPGTITTFVHDVERAGLDEFRVFFVQAIVPAAERSGLSYIAAFRTAFVENTFPVLPVRDASVFVWFARGDATAAPYVDREQASPAVLRALARKPEVLRLAPTARSLLR